MIKIKAVTSYLPENRIDNFEQAKVFSETDSFIKNKIGAFSLPIMSDEEETSDLAYKAVIKLCEEAKLEKNNIDALIVVTQNGDGSGLPHTSAILHKKLGLNTSVAAFDLSLGCSGYVYGLSVLKGIMENAGLKNGILVTADPYSKIIDRDDRITTLLFGDASTATWLCKEGLWEIGTPILETDGNGGDALQIVDGKLKMNGRSVFNFASLRVPQQINKCLKAGGLKPSDIDLYCLHQGSAAIIDSVARRFSTERGKFVKDIENTGNTVSSTIPVLLDRHVINSDAQTVLISGFGVGLSWATNILKKEHK